MFQIASEYGTLVTANTRFRPLTGQNVSNVVIMMRKKNHDEVSVPLRGRMFQIMRNLLLRLMTSTGFRPLTGQNVSKIPIVRYEYYNGRFRPLTGQNVSKGALNKSEMARINSVSVPLRGKMFQKLDEVEK